MNKNSLKKLIPLLFGLFLVYYSYNNTASLAFGWIVWTSQTLMIVVAGSLSFIFLPILNKNS